MSDPVPAACVMPSPPRCAGGFVLAACLLLLTVFAILGIAGLSAALVELRIASNVAERERAFQAAEYGIEQALSSAMLDTSLTPADPMHVPAGGGVAALPGASTDAFSSRVYFAGASPSGLPPAHPAAALTAFHFVIVATGFSSRGGSSTLLQSFKVLRPSTWTAGPADARCDPADAGCVTPPLPGPVRTSWVELEAE